MGTISTGPVEQMRGRATARRREPTPVGVDAARLVLVEALQVLQGTVTAFLEQLAGEPIDACGRRHTSGLATGSDHLDVTEGSPITRRVASLTGRRSLQVYVHAEAAIVADRLPPGLCRRLEYSNQPIGRVLAEFGVDAARRPPAEDRLLQRVLDRRSCGCEAASIYARAYLIDVAGRPAMAVSEWFLPTLVAPLLSRRP